MANLARRLAGGLLRLAIVGAGVAALIVGGGAWYVHVMSADRIATPDTVPEQPVALVLGAQAYPDGSPSPYLKGRLDVAYTLYRSGKVKAILVSGDNGSTTYNETDAMRDYLIARGIPATKIVGDHAGFDTYDSCVRAKLIFGVTKVTVVTQTYHLPRALATCRAVGLDAWGVGDVTGKANPEMWSYGTLREYAANVKMFWDVLSQREPVLGPRERGIDEALKED